MFKTLHTDEHRKLEQYQGIYPDIALIGWLKEQRVSRSLSMRELAEKLKTRHTLMGKVEQGERRLDVIEYVKYCEALGVSPIDGIDLVKTS